MFDDVTMLCAQCFNEETEENYVLNCWLVHVGDVSD